MKKAILIDDEKPALKELEFILKKYPEITVAGAFSNPVDGIAAIREQKPEVVFLDINMPQMLGIDVASEILDIDPAINVIFITAFDQYAIDAFEVHALDYLLKPIDLQRFEKTINRILKQHGSSEKPKAKFMIKCLGGFQAGWEGMDPIKWRADKTKEIFTFLLHHRNRDISKEELLDQLWPEDDPEKAIRQLYNGIYYIRKAMEEYGVGRELITIDKDYHMRLGPVDLDTDMLYEYGRKKTEFSCEELEAMAERYSGSYLQGEYYPWADFEREYLERLYVKCILALAEALIKKRHWERAEAYLLKAYQCSPFEEEISEHLVELYLESGNRNKAIRHYNGYAVLIEKELGIKPDARLKNMLREVK